MEARSSSGIYGATGAREPFRNASPPARPPSSPPAGRTTGLTAGTARPPPHVAGALRNDASPPRREPAAPRPSLVPARSNMRWSAGPPVASFPPWLLATGKVACGLGVVTGLSWALASVGATHVVVRVLSGTSVLDKVAASVPFIGPLLAVLMGVGGNYGFASVGAILFNLVDAAVADTKGLGGLWAWLRAHTGMAFALSPLWLAQATPVSAPVLLGIVAGVSYLSYMVQAGQNAPGGTPASPNFSHSLFAFGVALGLAPIGAQAASNVSSLNIARQAANFPLLAFGCNAIVAAGRHLYTMFGQGNGQGAGDLAPLATEHLRLPVLVPLASAAKDAANTGRISVWIPQDVALALEDFLLQRRAQIALKLHEGPRVMLLRAPAGAGKRSVAGALAQALQSRLYVLERSDLEANRTQDASQLLAERLTLWAAQAERLGRPVLVYVPEIAELAPRRPAARGPGQALAPADAAQATDDGDALASKLKTLLVGKAGAQAPNLQFIMGTSRTPEQLRTDVNEAIANRVTCTLSWPAPDAALLANIWRYQVERALTAGILHPELYAGLRQGDALATLLAQGVTSAHSLAQQVQQKLVGADVLDCVVQAMDGVEAAYLRARPPSLRPDAPYLDFALTEALGQRLCDALRERRPALDAPTAATTAAASTPTLPAPTSSVQA